MNLNRVDICDSQFVTKASLYLYLRASFIEATINGGKVQRILSPPCSNSFLAVCSSYKSKRQVSDRKG